jgi:hypothetical protein
MSLKIEIKRVIVVDGQEAELLLIACKMALDYLRLKQDGKLPDGYYRASSEKTPDVVRLLEQITRG